MHVKYPLTSSSEQSFFQKYFKEICYFDTHHNPSLTLIDLYELFKHHFQHKNRFYDEPSQC